MAKAPGRKPKEKKAPEATAYDQEDFDQIVAELEEQERLLEAAKDAKKKADKKIKNRAKAVNIPLAALNPALKHAAAIRKVLKGTESIHENLLEQHAEMVKSLLGDLADTPLGKAALTALETQDDKRRAGVHDDEQKHGGDILDRTAAPH